MEDGKRRTANVRDLSLKRVADACRGVAGKRTYYWDTRDRGFGLRVDANGVRSWLYDYRIEGRHRRMSLGLCADTLPIEARERFTELRRQVRNGVDPLEVKARSRSAEARARAKVATLGDVAERWLASLRLTRGARWSAEAERLYRVHVLSALGAMPVGEVEVRHIRALYESLQATPITANRVRAVLSGILNRALVDHDRPESLGNPVRAVKKSREPRRERFLDDSEWTRLGPALRKLERTFCDLPEWDTRPAQLRCITLLLLTGARRGALMPRRWADVDWQLHTIRVEPAHKGTSEIVLGSAAEQTLLAWRDRDRRASLFPGQARRGRDGAVSTLTNAWTLLRELAGLEDFVLHDLRRSFAVVAGDVGVSDHLIGGLLGHAVPGIRARYALRTSRAMRDAADRVSVEIARRLTLSSVTLPLRGALPPTRRSVRG